ncbi:MAG: DNA-directed RNA polymerase subunit alpha, partial [Candidatus Paceibacterota bacterium]
MSDQQIALPSKPKIVSEEGATGVYEIEGLYPGYGHTLGNSLRRIILSSLPGAAVTQLKIKGVSHEFSTLEGVKEDVIAIILNIKKIRFALNTDENQTITIKVSGEKEVKAKDLVLPSQVSIANPDLHLFTITNKNTEVEIELTIEHGIGYVPKEMIHRDRVDVGTIALDALFAPIRRVYYETENMRVGDRTDFNKLRITIETDGTMSPKQALEHSIEIMISQLKSIVGFKEEFVFEEKASAVEDEVFEDTSKESEMEDFLKTRVETLDLSARTISSLTTAGIRTVGGLARKKEED